MNRQYLFRRLRVLAVGLFVVACGCSSKGTVSGKVNYRGKPVVWGTVTVIASDNVQYAAQITPEGTYSIPNVPTGPAKFAVSSPNPDGTARGGPAAANGGAGDRGSPGEGGPPNPPPGAWFALPEKYSDPLQSGLTGTVGASSTVNLDLE
jgi:hypothetical protein